MIKKLSIGILVSALVFSCGSDKSSKSKFEDAMTNDSVAVALPEISTEALVEIINSIPPPIELSALIKEVGGKYSNDILNDTDNEEKYTTNFKKAVNLGIYGADLGYVSLYDQSQDAIDLVGSVKGLADNLGIGQFFDFETIKELAANKHNLDSLLFVSTNNFAKMNSYLQEQNRVSLSVLMLTGGWLEGLHIAAQIASTHESQELNERVGEQKVTLDQIILLLEIYKNDASIKELHNHMVELKEVFDKVEIVTVYQDSKMEEVDGVLVVVDQSTSTVNIPIEVLNEIKDKVDQIRNELIK